jgi:hypothetical protein
MRRLAELLKSAEDNYFTLDEVFEQARALPFERFDCPLCKSVFMSRLECAEHVELEHPMARVERPLFCEVSAYWVSRCHAYRVAGVSQDVRRPQVH